MPSLDDLFEEAMQDPVARAAYTENGIRRDLAEQIRAILRERSLTMSDLVGPETGLNETGVERLLHEDLGEVTLSMVVRLANALGLQVEITLA